MKMIYVKIPIGTVAHSILYFTTKHNKHVSSPIKKTTSNNSINILGLSIITFNKKSSKAQKDNPYTAILRIVKFIILNKFVWWSLVFLYNFNVIKSKKISIRFLFLGAPFVSSVDFTSLLFLLFFSFCIFETKF